MEAEKIAELARIAHEKREYFNMLGLVNTKTDYKERQEQSVEYEIARAAMLEADNNLRKAQGL